jgi:hypothetical protein
MVAPAKIDAVQETQGLIEFGARFVEGVTGGAVLLGQAPDLDRFRRLFDWPDVVVEVRADGSDLADTLQSFKAHPERERTISRRNAVEGLLRHDWIYRWIELFRVAGIAEPYSTQQRRTALHQLAEAARTGTPILHADRHWDPRTHSH